MRIHYLAAALSVVTSLALLSSCGDSSSDSTGAGGSGGLGNGTGVGGSTARMTIAGDYLYALAESDLQLFDITTPFAPNPWSRVNIARDVETIFPYEDYLLMGASSGMYIYDNTDKANPRELGSLLHAVAEDPVVASRNHAYVTLRSDSGGANQLDVIDISDPTNPTLVKSLGMQYPRGLSASSDGDSLYVCDDVAGLKTFDISDPTNPAPRDTLDVNCRDVIAHEQKLYAITGTELVQYDLTTSPPRHLSTMRPTRGQVQPVVVVLDE
ncbi:MAG: hypothetical protein CSB44_10360 [Gammaproteobacteria bacterium]|nr:MAG: hypothetical protein CSB44_10360 [Gammaproteobacteria bacterium]